MKFMKCHMELIKMQNLDMYDVTDHCSEVSTLWWYSKGLKCPGWHRTLLKIIFLPSFQLPIHKLSQGNSSVVLRLRSYKNKMTIPLHKDGNNTTGLWFLTQSLKEWHKRQTRNQTCSRFDETWKKKTIMSKSFKHDKYIRWLSKSIPW